MPRYKFSEIAYNITDKRMPNPEDKDLYIAPNNLDTETLSVYEYGYKVELKGSKLIMHKGDMLFGRREPQLKKAAIAPHDGLFSAHGMIFHPREETIVKEFFPFFIASDYFMDAAIRISVGSLSPTVNWSDLKDLEFDIPEIDEQRQYAKILWGIIRSKKAYKELISQTDELVKSQFIEMFGDGVDNHLDWKSGIISDYFFVKGGKRIPKGMTFCSEITGHPYLRTTDMKNGTIIDDDVHYIDENVFNHISRYVVAGGDIYLTNVGINLGMAGIIPDKYDGANLTENAVKLLPKTKELLSEFVSHYINMPQTQKYIEERKMAVGVPKLAVFRIESMPIIVPPKGLQQQYINLVHQIDKSKLAAKQALSDLSVMHKGLLEKCFC